MGDTTFDNVLSIDVTQFVHQLPCYRQVAIFTLYIIL